MRSYDSKSSAAASDWLPAATTRAGRLRVRSGMSNIQEGPDWWQASDLKWYPASTKPPNYPSGISEAEQQIPQALRRYGHVTADPSGRPFANLFLRLVALAVDAGVYGLVLLAISIARKLMAGPPDYRSGTMPVGGWLLLLIPMLAEILLLALRGVSLGNIITRTKVVATSGGPINILRATVSVTLRNIFAIVFGVGLVLDYFWPLVDPKHQTLHDKLSGTFVINTRELAHLSKSQ